MGKSLLAVAIHKAGGPEAFVAKVGRDMAAQLAGRSKLLGPPNPKLERIPWEAVARPEQKMPPGIAWLVWLILAGRGFGKTRVGAETVVAWVRSGDFERLALVAPTASDARDVMVEGESGLVAVSEADGFPAEYEPSKRRVTWPNGAMATLFSAEEPDRLRGPQHDGAWLDELAAWADAEATYDQLQFGLRLGKRPRVVVTTTPRPVPIIRRLVSDPATVITKGSTFDNADNLASSFLEKIKAAYEGTRLGRQELYAEILDDNPGALWKRDQIDRARVRVLPEMQRIGVGVDPAVSANNDSDETGIVCAGVAKCGCRGGKPELHGFVIEDASGIYTPDGWAKAVAKLYHAREADRVIAEVNQGGDLVESNLRTLGDQEISYLAVHAARGKVTRAEPIAALYEQGKIHHIGTGLSKLEDQMTEWNPLLDGRSPDRVDALVWVLTWLMLEDQLRPGWEEVL